MRQRFLPLALTIAAVLAACTSMSEEQTGSTAVPGGIPVENSVEKLSPAQRDIATLAIDALAADLGIARDRISVDTVRAVEWPDSSVGCPKPGQAYLQVITPGHKITLRAEDRIHVVHEANGRAQVCRNTKAFAGLNPQRELVFGKQMMDARKDLAALLGVAESEIKPQSAEQHTWEDAGLGCPESGVAYPPGKVNGWVMKLRHGSRDYSYHTDLQRSIPCPSITAE
ncbi:MAG: hypothetical protein ACREVI_05745 [Steroidobacteraceae bacterium]